MRTGCVDVHQHDETGHNILKICNADFVRLIYGDVLNVQGHLIKAIYSTDFNDLSHECIMTTDSHYTCWEDIASMYKEDEECSLYGETWLCYHQVQDAWQHGDCLWVDQHEACEENFYDIAQRHCTTIQGTKMCPRAFGVREVNPEVQHAIYHEEGKSHLENMYQLWSEKHEPEMNWCGGAGLTGAHCESAYDCHGCTCVNHACYADHNEHSAH